jgi:hypothetical protein
MGLILKNVNITGGKLSSTSSSNTSTTSTSRSTATLMKTGQTTSYRTGDDGDIEAGRESDFLTLDSAPLHNDGTATINTTTNRFTDTLGGQTYANNIVLDWSTWNGVTVLGYFRTLQSVKTWDNAIDSSSGTFGTFENWRNANVYELVNLMNLQNEFIGNYAPLNWGNSGNFWSSNTYAVGSTIAYHCLNTNNIRTALKTAVFRNLPVRTFNLSTSNILS